MSLNVFSLFCLSASGRVDTPGAAHRDRGTWGSARGGQWYTRAIPSRFVAGRWFRRTVFHWTSAPCRVERRCSCKLPARGCRSPESLLLARARRLLRNVTGGHFHAGGGDNVSNRGRETKAVANGCAWRDCCGSSSFPESVDVLNSQTAETV